MSQRATDGCIFNADPCAADDAVEAAFFTQPSNRLAMTLPAFRASRLISTSSNDSRNGLPLWARTVLAIHLLGVNRVSQRAKRSLSKLALFLNGTCGSARRFPTSASTNRTPPRGAAHDDAYGVWNADSSAFNPRRALTFPVLGPIRSRTCASMGCYPDR